MGGPAGVGGWLLRLDSDTSAHSNCAVRTSTAAASGHHPVGSSSPAGRALKHNNPPSSGILEIVAYS